MVGDTVWHALKILRISKIILWIISCRKVTEDALQSKKEWHRRTKQLLHLHIFEKKKWLLQQLCNKVTLFWLASWKYDKNGKDPSWWENKWFPEANFVLNTPIHHYKRTLTRLVSSLNYLNHIFSRQKIYVRISHPKAMFQIKYPSSTELFLHNKLHNACAFRYSSRSWEDLRG